MSDFTIGFFCGIILSGIVALSWDDYGYPYEYHAGVKACIKNDGLKEWGMNGAAEYTFNCNDGAKFLVKKIGDYHEDYEPAAQ